MELQSYNRFEDLPASAQALINMQGNNNVFLSADWYSLFEEQVGSTLGVVKYVVLSEGEDALVILPTLEREGWLGYKKIYALANYYSAYFSVFTHPDHDRRTLLDNLF